MNSEWRLKLKRQNEQILRLAGSLDTKKLSAADIAEGALKRVRVPVRRKRL
jgi:hypothetical protein